MRDWRAGYPLPAPINKFVRLLSITEYYADSSEIVVARAQQAVLARYPG